VSDLWLHVVKGKFNLFFTTCDVLHLLGCWRVHGRNILNREHETFAWIM